MKKIKTPYFFATVSMCLIVASCNASKPSHKIWFSYASENLMADINYFDNSEENMIYQNRDKTLRFNCMKNENEGAQLMITASDYISEFDFELPDVTDGTNTITKDHFTVSAAWYMEVGYSNERSTLKGFYPDALVPLENYKFRRQNFIQKGRNQALYINLKTDENTLPGTYKGSGKLTLDGVSTDIPFEVKIYDATLPNASHQKNSYLIWYDQIANGEGKNAGVEMNQIYYDFAVSKRLSPDGLPPEYSSTPEIFADSVAEFIATNDMIPSLRMPLNYNSYSKSKAKSYLQALVNKNLELRTHDETKDIDLFKKLYFYIDDEPTASRYDEVREHDNDIFELKNELVSLLSAYPDLQYSLTHMNNIVTVPFNSELIATDTQGGVETWCPQINHFHTEEGRATYKARQESSDRAYGEHVWWYTCMTPTSPYPNYHLDYSLLPGRALRYMEYQYDIEGFLFWCINYYSQYKRGVTGNRDIWYDPDSWDGCAGDGFLVYPGLTYGIKGPITTLRLENILAGNEEGEYLWMIEQKVNEYNSANNTTYVAKDLLAKYFSRLYSGVVAVLDVNNFESTRLDLLSLVESLYQDVNEGMKVLLAK